MNARRGRNKVDKREGLSVELPVFGVGLSEVSEETVWVNINNTMPYGKPDQVVCLPVAKPGDAIRYQLYRKAGVSLPPTPLAADIGLTIEKVQMDAFGVGPGMARRSKNQRTREPFDDSLRERVRYLRAAVPRVRWPDVLDDASAGLLFLMIFGVYEEDDESGKGRVAVAIADLLRTVNVSRCVVPTRSTKRVVGAANTPHTISDELSFVLASCHYPAGMVDGTPPLDDLLHLDPGPADESYCRLNQRLESGLGRPELILLAGDQVYVDATAGLFDPSAVDGRFIRPYEQRYSNAYVQHVTRQAHVVPILDDHEIVDNFENEGDVRFSEHKRKGIQAYIDYQRSGSLLGTPNDFDRLWCELVFHPYEFFLADTRTGRSKRTTSNFPASRIMSADQFADLEEFLRPNKWDKRPRFVVSPSVLLPRRLSTLGSDPPDASRDAANVLCSDAWDGFPASFNAIFELIAREQIYNVVFLSGDEHRCCWSQANLRDSDISVLSIHSSALYAPYIFANSIEEDFVPNETLTIPASHRARETTWEVTSTFAPKGQGFALLRVAPKAAHWAIEVEFELGNEPNLMKEFLLPR